MFRTSLEGGVVERLPFNICEPKMFRTADDVYSLFVVEIVEDGANEDGTKKFRTQLREISVPNTDLYVDKVVDVQSLIERDLAERGVQPRDISSEALEIDAAIMQDFVFRKATSSFFVLSNKGFYRIFYTNKIGQVSIDKLDGVGGFKVALEESLRNTIMQNHIEKDHHGEKTRYFDILASKVNQFTDTFSTFDLIPTEFGDTQDIGVIPSSKVDDIDNSTDHRPDSVQVSTDILYTDGMFVDADSNPGLITCAVANPATTYDDDQVFLKAQRNPLLIGTEFYDYIHDTKGNVLMDLYAIPFIYRVNSNNTYDVYINVPTTRTKYMNRIAGTLKDDLTSLVQLGDVRTRKNLSDQVLANNLDESTTRLRVYIDRKYISIGNVELVEISGNSIPLQIYRDEVNDGLYDSIALESRWDGELVELDKTDNDINKVMLEFECYGTDSQSIHISGKTLIHHALDDRKYEFG